jgi:ArsR family transcriptional regulator
MEQLLTALPAIMNWMQSLSDVTRARIVRLLERGELTVAELCSVLQLPQSTVSRHLKVLADDGWVSSRREATSRYYQLDIEALGSGARRLWHLIREQTAESIHAEVDDQRLTGVLADRQSRSQAFFNSAAGQWDRMRSELFGQRFDLLALPGLLDPSWTVADLGCGTGQIAQSLGPFVRKVIAVDHNAAMLKAARQRLKALTNVEVRSGDLIQLPIDDATVDAAVIYLVLHHLPSPEAAIAEAVRTLKRGGRLLIVDMMAHDRREYQQQMGHVWLGFAGRQIETWMKAAGLTQVRHVELGPEAAAKGPMLFAASGVRK